MDKKELRSLVAARKKEYSDSQLTFMSRRITDRIRQLPCCREAKTVFAYMDLPGEVKMREFIRMCWADGKTVAVPKIVPLPEGRNERIAEETEAETAAEPDCSGKRRICREMCFYQIDSFDVLKEGAMHIMEPDPERCRCLDMEAGTLIIMPGVVFDTDRRRIGYGGGFYDRYLAAHSEHPTVAAAFQFQVFDRIPSEEHDIRPQILVTEERIIE